MSTHPQSERKAPTLWIFLFLLGLGFSLFFSSWSNPFILDDISKIVQNPDIRDISQILRKWVYPYAQNKVIERNDPSRPLVFLLYTVLYTFFGANPIPFHALNTLLHCLTSFVLFLLTRKILQQGSPLTGPLRAKLTPLLVSLLFLVLPIEAGTVVYAYGLSDLLVGLGIACSLYFYSNSRTFSGLSYLSYVLALASKQIAVVTPALIVAYDLCFSSPFVEKNRPEWKKRLPLYAPYFLITFLYLGLRIFYFDGLGDLEAYSSTVPWWDYFSVQGVVILKYITLTFIPTGLSIDHDIESNQYSILLKFISWSIVLLAASFSGLQILRPNPLKKNQSSATRNLLAFGILFFLINLIPTSSFFPTVDTLVERRVYLANFGLYLGMVWLLFQTPDALLRGKAKTQAAPAVALFLLLIFYGYKTLERNTRFASPKEIWKESLVLYPDNARALNNLGAILIDENRFDEALACFRKILDHTPESPLAWINIGVVYGHREYSGFSLAQARDAFEHAYRLNPQNYTTAFNLAFTYGSLGDFSQAEAFYLKSLELFPNFFFAHYNLGNLYLRLGRKKEAQEQFEQARSQIPR